MERIRRKSSRRDSNGAVWGKRKLSRRQTVGFVEAEFNCGVVVWFYGLFFINSIVRYQADGICPVAELEIQFHRICAVPLISRGNRLREETPRTRLRVLAKRLNTLKSRDCYKTSTRRSFPLYSMARWYKVRFSFLLLKRDFSRL